MNKLGNKERNNTATGYMLSAVIIWSLVPLVIDLGGASQIPFLFNSAWHFSTFVGCLIYLFALYPSLLLERTTLARIWLRIRSRVMLFAVFSQCNYAFFALATRFVDIAVVAILYETWPLLLIFLVARLFKDEDLYRNLTPGMILLLFLGFIGFAFVVTSQAGEFEWHFSLSLVTGILLAMVAAVAISMSAYAFKWGRELGKELFGNVDSETRQKHHITDDKSLDTFGTIVCVAISCLLASIITSAVGVVNGEIPIAGPIKIGLGAGLISSIAVISWRKANLMTSNLGVNALAYATPVFALLWLALFSRVEVPKPDYLVIGASAIVATNLLVYFEQEIRMGYKSLVLALWGGGAFVCLRDEETEWGSGGEYFSFLALSSTLFALILSFRVSRFVQRTTSEETLALTLWHQITRLPISKENKKNACALLQRIDAHANAEELRTAYVGIKNLIGELQCHADLSNEDKNRLAEIGAQIDMLAHSKQQGLNYGELAALSVFAFLTSFVALAFRPVGLGGWSGFVVEFFTVLFVAAVVFLYVNVLDLQNDRDAPIWKKTTNGNDGRVDLKDFKRLPDRWISIVLSLTIATAYGYLLWNKWLI